ncbi:unnamed protein product [Bathycoccus prasinos]
MTNQKDDDHYGKYQQYRPQNLPESGRLHHGMHLAPENQPYSSDDLSKVEREFWKKVTYDPPTYCADVPEDADLYSVNFIHFGAPKCWYAIAPKDRKRFEILVQGMLPELWRACPQFLRHKEIMISPAILHQNGIEAAIIVVSIVVITVLKSQN